VAFSSTGFLPNLPSDGTSSPIQSQRTIESHIKTPESSPKRSVASGGLSAGIPQHLLSPNNFAGLASNPLLELSSTQVLINMVRNASTLHQNQLHKTSSEIQNQQKFQSQLLLQHQQQLHQQQIQQQKDKLQSFQKQINADESRQSLKMLENSRGLKRPAHSSSPLDLSAAVPSKHARTSESDINVEDDETPAQRTSQDDDTPAPRTSPAVTISPVHVKNEQPYRSPCQRHVYSFETKENSLTWSVDDVYDFVRSIDICAEYAEVSRK
jgi:TolA-binding protein